MRKFAPFENFPLYGILLRIVRRGLWVRTSEIPSAGFSAQVSVAKIIHISSIQEALSLLFSLFLLSIADTFAHSANLKLRQANARAKGKVARARARVCRGLATPLEGGRMWRANLKEEGGREVKVRGRGGRREGGEGERQGRKEGLREVRVRGRGGGRE